MKAYIAYQPIHDQFGQVTGHELFYRDGSGNAARVPKGPAGDAATRKVVHDAFTLFDFQNEAPGAFFIVQFTPNLILDDFIRKINPDRVIAQLVGSDRIDEKLESKILALRNEGYAFSLKHYAGQRRLREYLYLFDIIRVDCRLERGGENFIFWKEATRNHGALDTYFIADRIERESDFDQARNRAADKSRAFFQGYYWGRPTVREMEIPPLVETPYGKILLSLSKIPIYHNEWWVECARVIEADMILSYLFPREAKALPPPPRRIIQNRVIWLCILLYIVCNPIICAAGRVWRLCGTETSPGMRSFRAALIDAACSWINSRTVPTWL